MWLDFRKPKFLGWEVLIRWIERLIFKHRECGNQTLIPIEGASVLLGKSNILEIRGYKMQQ